MCSAVVHRLQHSTLLLELVWPTSLGWPSCQSHPKSSLFSSDLWHEQLFDPYNWYQQDNNFFSDSSISTEVIVVSEIPSRSAISETQISSQSKSLKFPFRPILMYSYWCFLVLANMLTVNLLWVLLMLLRVNNISFNEKWDDFYPSMLCLGKSTYNNQSVFW